MRRSEASRAYLQALSTRLNRIRSTAERSTRTVTARTLGRDRQREAHARLLGVRDQAPRDAREQLLDRDALARRRVAAALEARVGEHVLDQVGLALRLAAEGGEVLPPLLFALDHPLEQHVGVDPEGGERRAQLVGDRRHEGRAALAEGRHAEEQSARWPRATRRRAPRRPRAAAAGPTRRTRAPARRCRAAAGRAARPAAASRPRHPRRPEPARPPAADRSRS